MHAPCEASLITGEETDVDLLKLAGISSACLAALHLAGWRRHRVLDDVCDERR
jgi:hypothetical protein